MNNQRKINNLFNQQDFNSSDFQKEAVYKYAEAIAAIEKAVVVVSDLKHNISRIFNGQFSDMLGLSGRESENSIWENEILGLMTQEECDCKYLAELRFYNFLRTLPRHKRGNYYLATNLRFNIRHDTGIDVLHRMYYLHDESYESVCYAVCIYAPAPMCLPVKSAAVDMLTGKWVELGGSTDKNILSTREKEVLNLIARGLTSHAIAETFSISKNTVSRHRQQILAKLQVKNSMDACRIARQLGVI